MSTWIKKRWEGLSPGLRASIGMTVVLMFVPGGLVALSLWVLFKKGRKT